MPWFYKNFYAAKNSIGTEHDIALIYAGVPADAGSRTTAVAYAVTPTNVGSFGIGAGIIARPLASSIACTTICG